MIGWRGEPDIHVVDGGVEITQDFEIGSIIGWESVAVIDDGDFVIVQGRDGRVRIPKHFVGEVAGALLPLALAEAAR